jgi:negative regulator of flagellin synthesis FlgM
MNSSAAVNPGRLKFFFKRADKCGKIRTKENYDMSVSRIQDGNAQMIQQKYLRNEQVRAESERQANGGAVSSPSERVDLSTTAKDIQQLKDALSKLPDVREEKVQEVQRMLKDGTYKIDADQIAGKMVGESILDLFV